MIEYFLLFLPFIDPTDFNRSFSNQQMDADFSPLGEIVSIEDFSGLYKEPAFAIGAKLNGNFDWDKAASYLTALGYRVNRLDERFRALHLTPPAP